MYKYIKYSWRNGDTQLEHDFKNLIALNRDIVQAPIIIICTGQCDPNLQHYMMPFCSGETTYFDSQ
jgi:hypothetical protein